MRFAFLFEETWLGCKPLRSSKSFLDCISFMSASESDSNSFAFDSNSSQREGNDMGEIDLRGYVGCLISTDFDVPP